MCMYLREWSRMEEIFYQPISCVTSSVLDYGESVSRLQGMGGGA